MTIFKAVLYDYIQSDSLEDKSFNQSKGVDFLEASLLGCNLPDHGLDLINGVLEAMQGYVPLGVGREMCVQDLEAGACGDGLAVKGVLDVFLCVVWRKGTREESLA